MPIELADHHVVKRLSSRERNEPEAVARLRSEAAILEALSNLGATPRLLSRGENELGPWHRVERITMPTLAERLATTHGPLEPRWIERAVRSTFQALAVVHEAVDDRGPLDIVHADLGPANVGVDEVGTSAVLLDFDLAWWRDGPTRDGAFRGTITYAAPEVARGRRPTVQSDLFSLAAALLHAVTGKAPRVGSSFPALLASAAEEPVLDAWSDAIRARGPGHAAVVACLAFDVADRPRSARQVIERLDASLC